MPSPTAHETRGPLIDLRPGEHQRVWFNDPTPYGRIGGRITRCGCRSVLPLTKTALAPGQRCHPDL